MNIMLVAINAKYIHSSLAAYSLYAYLSEDEKKHVQIKEFTVNQSEELITSEIFRAKPDVLAFSCYIWNIDLVLSLAETFKKIMPRVPIIVGGPEASYEFSSDLVDIVVSGEGEARFRQLVQEFTGGANNQTASIIPLEQIPFPYEGRFPSLANRIIYYETSRGCVNNCGFCLSSATEGVRFLPLARVYSDLDKFLAAGVKQVKFVDRTFNASRQHATAIWEYLIRNDNGITNFHFEIAGERLDHQALILLGKARKGLFQFEIGVQSTNPQTLETIRRTTDTEKLFENVRHLMKLGNIHLHLDLIVGLPHEDYESFKRSFNDVFALRPHKLQVGFLKLLKGSRLRKDAQKYGIEYKKSAPYSVLKNDFMDFEQIGHIKKIEHMVETFYTAAFHGTVKFMLSRFPSPFDFFDMLAKFWDENELHMVSHKKAAMYSYLYEFGKKYIEGELHPVCELLKFDMLLQENIRTFPPFIAAYYQPDNRQITRTTGVHMFDYNICEWLESDAPFIKKQIKVEFDYSCAVDDGRYKA